MKAKELAQELLKHPDAEVYSAIDDEGNGYNVVWQCSYDPVRIIDGEVEVYAAEWSADEAGFESEEDWEEVKKNRAFVL